MQNPLAFSRSKSLLGTGSIHGALSPARGGPRPLFSRSPERGLGDILKGGGKIRAFPLSRLQGFELTTGFAS